uniref:RILP-like protein 1 n=1 Tax=Nothobranchius furzeri TaxID=105023 RepID=A0A8C6KTW2_NOTFU
MEGFGSALEKNAADLTVMDVYDIAAVVGQEFERIIDQYGCEALSRLMPKVVRVLEILEVMVSRSSMSPDTEELRLELDRLRLERIERLEKERKHRQVAQDIHQPSKKTQSEVWTLPTLRSSVCLWSPGMTEKEKQVMLRLKEVVDKQRDEIRAKDRELSLKNEDIEALQQQQSRLMKINHDLRHKISVVEAQGKALIGQKVELEAGAQAQAQEVGALRQEVARLRERLQVEASTQNPEEAPPLPPSPAEMFCSNSGLFFFSPVSKKPPGFIQQSTALWVNSSQIWGRLLFLSGFCLCSDEAEDEIESPSPELRTRSRSSAQPESGIKRLFSFFSRDKQRGSQLDAGSGPWTRRDEAYTEQAQEALQHL